MKILFLLALLAGCATAPLDNVHKAAVDQVAVVTQFEDNLPIRSLGTTIFNNQDANVSVASWKVNKEFVDAWEAGLKALGKKTVKVSFDPRKIEEAKASGNTAWNRFMGNVDKDLHDYLLDTAASKGARYLLIVQPLRSSNTPHAPGYGLFCRAPVGMSGNWESYFQFHASLWNVADGKKIYQGAFVANDINKSSGKPCDEFKKMTPEKFAQLFKADVLGLARRSPELILDRSGLSRP